MAPETLAKNSEDNGGKNLTRILTSGEINEANRGQTGGKAYALARLVRAGFRVPDFLCVTAEVYREFLQKSGLGPRIFFELQRKPFEEMRWKRFGMRRCEFEIVPSFFPGFYFLMTIFADIPGLTKTSA